MLCKLTNTEEKVYSLLSQGLNDKEIADKLFIGVSTVRTHKKNIFKKTGIHSLQELLAERIKELEIEVQFFRDYIKITNEVQNEYEQQLNQLKAQLLDQEAETLKAGGIISLLEQTLAEIKEYLQPFKKKKSNFYTINDVVTDIANNIEKIISEVLEEGE